MKPFSRVFVKVGGDLPLPEGPFEGAEPLSLKRFPESVVLVQPCALGWGCCFEPVGACLR